MISLETTGEYLDTRKMNYPAGVSLSTLTIEQCDELATLITEVVVSQLIKVPRSNDPDQTTSQEAFIKLASHN